MKCFVIVGIVTVLALNINGLNFKPNIQVTLKSLNEFNYMEYSIEPLMGSTSPLHLTKAYIISLKSFKFNQNQNWWSIVFQHSNQYKCNYLADVSLEEVENVQDNNFVEFDTWEGKMHEILYTLHDNTSKPILMEFYGCKRAKNNDKIHQIEINMVLVKDSEPITVKVWNKTLTFYPSFLGYFQIKNIANTSNTDEENELIFRDLLQYCQHIADIPEYRKFFPSFEAFYRNDSLKTLKEPTLIMNYIPIVTVATIILLLIICIGFCSTYSL